MKPLEALRQAGATQDGLATRADLRAAGLSSGTLSRAVQDGRLVRQHPGVYASTPLPALPRFLIEQDLVTPEARLHARAALLALGPESALVGRSAAVLRGWGLLEDPRATEIGLPHGRRRRQLTGVHTVQVRTLLIDLVVVETGQSPLAMATAVDTAVTCCLHQPLLEAVVAVDSGLRRGDLALAELRTRAVDLSGQADAEHVRQVLSLVDPRSGSVLESVLRVHMLQDGLTGFVSQRVVVHRGVYVLRTDFCFEDARLVVETDGRLYHPDADKDRVTSNALCTAGWRVLRFTWAEVLHQPAWVLAQIRAALASA